jgi:hypothetical protein
LRKEAARTREFLATSAQRQNRKGQELKTNITDPESAKMATSKGVIQGYAAQAAVDSAHQIIVAAEVIGSGAEQSMLLPMIEQSQPYREAHTLITANAGYHSDANVQQLMQQNIPAMIADNQMRQRDERFANQAKHKGKDDPLYEKKATAQPQAIRRFSPKDFSFNDDNTYICPAGNALRSKGSIYTMGNGLRRQDFVAREQNCAHCPLRAKCLKHPDKTKARKVVRYHARQINPMDASLLMRAAIDSPRGRQLYSQRIGTVEPVFDNIRHNKRLNRLSHCGHSKVNTQWNLYCMVHNIEKLSKTGLGQ